jgi:membrane protease YdiL (CAAX protease family)
MTAWLPLVRRASTRQAWLAVLLLLGFGASLAVRVVVGRPDVPHAAGAGLLFAGSLTLLTVAARTRVTMSRRTVGAGVAGGIVLCLPVLFIRITAGTHHPPAGNYLLWALVVSLVAFAEEAFLRGAFYDVITAVSNQTIAIIVAASAFAVLHIPLYGLTSVPLDFGAGLLLGSLRLATGTFVGPGIAHTVADLAGWWLR